MLGNVQMLTIMLCLCVNTEKQQYKYDNCCLKASNCIKKKLCEHC